MDDDVLIDGLWCDKCCRVVPIGVICPHLWQWAKSPSAADLDKMAEENRIRELTSGKTQVSNT